MFIGIGVLATALQVYDVFRPDQISRANVPVGLVILALALMYGAIRSWPRPIRQQYTRPNTGIRIVEGDLFDQSASLVIGMCDTFDTEVPHIIAQNSVQGQFLAKVYASDQKLLDQALKASLAGASPCGTIAKPGKRTRYPIGTVAVIRHQDRRHFYCLAYTEMNEQNEARASIGGVWQSLECLWREVRISGNGAPVAIPVIGGGQARLSQILPRQDSIRLMALSFMLASRHEKVCDWLDIVVRSEDVSRLDMLELRDFLKSLEES